MTFKWALRLPAELRHSDRIWQKFIHCNATVYSQWHVNAITASLLLQISLHSSRFYSSQLRISTRHDCYPFNVAASTVSHGSQDYPLAIKDGLLEDSPFKSSMIFQWNSPCIGYRWYYNLYQYTTKCSHSNLHLGWALFMSHGTTPFTSIPWLCPSAWYSRHLRLKPSCSPAVELLGDYVSHKGTSS